MSLFLILLAAGDSKRLKSNTPKPYNKVNNKTLLEHSLDAFQNFDKIKKPSYVWCTAESDKHGLNFYSCARNKTTKHCSGDHGF